MRGTNERGKDEREGESRERVEREGRRWDVMHTHTRACTNIYTHKHTNVHACTFVYDIHTLMQVHARACRGKRETTGD